MINVPSEVYVPTTIGARKSCFTAVLGALYCAKKTLQIQNTKETSVELSAISTREREREDQNAFTKKLKNILMNK